MSKKRGLSIKVANPCSENWDSMIPRDNGRFCNNCKKIVFDFSALSNQEFYNFFAGHSNIPCGRFRNDQLNEKILPLKHRKLFFKNIYKIAAASFAFLITRYPAIASDKRKDTITMQPIAEKNKICFNSGKIIISGNVKDMHGHKLENAEIKFGETIIVKTDSAGNFRFEIQTNNEIKPSLLLISYPELVPVVRNYHPAMLSASYDITLYELDKSGGYTMGIPIRNDTLDFPPIIINNDGGDGVITNEIKASLATLAVKLRNNPETRINIVAHSGKKNTLSRSAGMQKMVKIFLIEQEGISAERIKLIIENNLPEKQNIVIIKPASGDD